MLIIPVSGFKVSYFTDLTVRLEQSNNLVADSNESGFTEIKECISMLSVIMIICKYKIKILQYSIYGQVRFHLWTNEETDCDCSAV